MREIMWDFDKPQLYNTISSE